MDERESMDDLIRLIRKDGVFVLGFAGGGAAVGDLRDLDYLAEAAGIERDEALGKLGMGHVIDLACLGSGATRLERIRTAWEDARHLRDLGDFPRMVAVRERLGLPVTDPKELGTFGFGDFGDPIF